MRLIGACRLYTFVDMAYLNGRDPVEIARQLAAGGADLIQLRAKDWQADAVRRLAERLLPVTTAAGVGLVINDYPRIAAAVGTGWCHLGQEDFFDAGHRHASEINGDGALDIGLSSHAPEQARRAVEAGAGYVAIGPVFATGTKPHARPVTLDYVSWARSHLHVPWFAIGGITLQRLPQVVEAGARRICVVSAILQSPSIEQACKQFRNRLETLAP